MTRKDYVLLSNIIKANADRYHEHTSKDVIGVLANDLATALKEENQRFDRVLFMQACGI